jgi:hypothetical protein
MVDVIRFPGTVEWSGENPGIFLKAAADGPFTTLATFFRVVLSPHGRGHALVLVQPPNEYVRTPAVCLTDNEPLARWLVEEFVTKFGAFKGIDALSGLVYRLLDSVESGGDPSNIYSETVRSGDLTVTLTWSGLGLPFCFANPPALSATGMHHMPSLFVGCLDASIQVNGRRLLGSPIPREVAGRKITSAMLAFSETWIRAE